EAVGEGNARVRLSKAAQIALRALREALDEVGAIPPASNHIPAGVRCVSIDQWRRNAYARGISTSEKPRARQAAFQRAVEHLNGSVIGIWGDHAWPVRPIQS